MKRGIIICAPADALLTVSGASYDRVCTRCGSKVMLAPSGQRMTAEHPNVMIVCTLCVEPTGRDREILKGAVFSVAQLKELLTLAYNKRAASSS